MPFFELLIRICLMLTRPNRSMAKRPNKSSSPTTHLHPKVSFNKLEYFFGVKHCRLFITQTHKHKNLGLNQILGGWLFFRPIFRSLLNSETVFMTMNGLPSGHCPLSLIHRPSSLPQAHSLSGLFILNLFMYMVECHALKNCFKLRTPSRIQTNGTCSHPSARVP